MFDERLEFDAAPGKPIDVQRPFGRVIAQQRSDRYPVPPLRLQTNARRVRRRVQMLIARTVLGRAGDADRDRDASAAATVRLRKDVAANSSAQPLGNLPRGRCCRAEEYDQLVAARM